jgi:hypothetical protein
MAAVTPGEASPQVVELVQWARTHRLDRARCNSAASLGRFAEAMEGQA